VGNKGSVACVSAPTLYKHLKLNLANSDPAASTVSLKVFEFDKRFARYGSDFVFYDYRSPLDIPREMRESFDLVFADPPFLSEECLTKTAVTVKYLAKKRIVLCTGAIMADLADRLLREEEAPIMGFVFVRLMDRLVD
jgi:16S rRNA G966 N2-methylase RsmD